MDATESYIEDVETGMHLQLKNCHVAFDVDPHLVDQVRNRKLSQAAFDRYVCVYVCEVCVCMNMCKCVCIDALSQSSTWITYKRIKVLDVFSPALYRLLTLSNFNSHLLSTPHFLSNFLLLFISRSLRMSMSPHSRRKDQTAFNAGHFNNLYIAATVIILITVGVVIMNVHLRMTKQLKKRM
jgi:hypothetical protein